MHANQLLILGAGGHASVVAESAQRAGWTVIGHAAVRGDGIIAGDPDADGAAFIETAVAGGVRIHAAVGSCEVRARWWHRFGGAAFATVIDPTAIVSSTAEVLAGAYVGAGAVLQAHATVGPCAIINTRAVVEHDCTIGACAHIAPGAVLCGSVEIGDQAFMGAGAVVTPGLSIGASATVGAGAVVVRLVEAGTTVVGVPARPIHACR